MTIRARHPAFSDEVHSAFSEEIHSSFSGDIDFGWSGSLDRNNKRLSLPGLFLFLQLQPRGPSFGNPLAALTHQGNRLEVTTRTYLLPTLTSPTCQQFTSASNFSLILQHSSISFQPFINCPYLTSSQLVLSQLSSRWQDTNMTCRWLI